MKAGFAEINISPEYFPIRTYMASKENILDPVFAHAAVLENNGVKLVFLSLDVVIIEWEYVKIIREKIFVKTGIPEKNILVCATHNHACPAVVERGSFKKEDRYVDFMLEQAVKAALAANSSLEKVVAGIASGTETRVSFNRRFIKNDGTVISQPIGEKILEELSDREGPVDPEVGVVCFKNMKDEVMGLLVNFSCHACHNLGSISAGFPGVMNRRLKEIYGQKCACLFLNGACGNVIHNDFLDTESNLTDKYVGGILAGNVESLMEDIDFSPDWTLDVLEETLRVEYRDSRDLEECVKNPDRFINVFPGLIKLGWYDHSLEKLNELKKAGSGIDIKLQIMEVGPVVFAAIPAEYFSEFALRIKRESRAKKTFVVTLANGWLGYIPTQDAFKRRGGHETTTAIWSKMEPEAGNKIADKVIEIINS